MSELPPPSDTTSDTLHTRIPAPLAEAVDRFADACGLNRSEAVRALLSRALESCDLWPPPRFAGREVRRG